MAEDKIAALFGNGKLSYDELLIKAGESGIEVGDVLEIRKPSPQRKSKARA